MLSAFLTTHRKKIVAHSRAKVASRAAPRATPIELETGVPLFLDQLIATLRNEESRGEAAHSDRQIGLSAAKHGKALQEIGFTAAQVIHDYGDVCQAITELAIELDASITADEFRTLNRCLDEAMAESVTEYGRQRELSISDDETERLGFFAHELRNLLSNSMLAFEVLKTGSVGVGGSTGTVLGRNLTRMRDLIDRSLAEVRLKAGIKRRERVLLPEFIEEVEVAATIEAKARGLQLTVAPVPRGVSVEADRQTLAAAVANLLQNAFKFTRPSGHVVVRTHADADRAFIAIEDECGGLAGRPEDLFAPFEQRSKDRSGLGLGLAIAREGVSANGGEIKVRNIAGRGCIFTIELPRLPLDAVDRPDAAEVEDVAATVGATPVEAS
ncbi:MAG TPA: HAMP domain-containing sensor histidine kinase [Vicinamibacteria bacterium]|nr:HAMP domain-containing sensor histidine kinase [Vicinamibacteria bacterium]